MLWYVEGAVKIVKFLSEAKNYLSATKSHEPTAIHYCSECLANSCSLGLLLLDWLCQG